MYSTEIPLNAPPISEVKSTAIDYFCGERHPELRTISALNNKQSNSFKTLNRPFAKMAAEHLIKSKFKTNTSTRKSTLTLVTLPSFGISGKISAEKM